MSSQKIIYLDASSLTRFGPCGRALYYNNYLGLQTKNNLTAPLWFGSCLHVFAENYIKTGDFGTSASQAINLFKAQTLDYSKTYKHLDAQFLAESALAVQQFLDQKTFDILCVSDEQGTKQHLCEIKFAEPVIVNSDLAILMSGTMDLAIKYRQGQYVIADWKTTNSFDIQKYLDGYHLSAQLLTYRWFIWRKAKQYPESIYAQMGKDIGAQIFAVGTASGKVPQVTTSQVFRFNEEHILTFDRALRLKAATLMDSLTRQELPPMEGLLTGTCAMKFAQCQYAPLCGAFNDEHREALMPQLYREKTYNPLEFR